MEHIIFACPNCSQSLEAFPNMTGQLVDCPKCNNEVEVPERTEKILLTQTKEDAKKTQPCKCSCNTQEKKDSKE